MNEDKFYEQLGLRITQERLSAGVRQEDLANYLELSRASIVNIEKGRQRPSTFMLLNIAKYLRIDFTKLIPSAEAKETEGGVESSFDISNITGVNLNTNSESLKNFLDLIKK